MFATRLSPPQPPQPNPPARTRSLQYVWHLTTLSLPCFAFLCTSRHQITLSYTGYLRTPMANELAEGRVGSRRRCVVAVVVAELSVVWLAGVTLAGRWSGMRRWSARGDIGRQDTLLGPPLVVWKRVVPEGKQCLSLCQATRPPYTV